MPPFSETTIPPTILLSRVLGASGAQAGFAALLGATFDAVGAAATVGAALVTHAARTDNPHATTAAQVGAYTSGATDTLLALKAPLASPTFTGTPAAPTPTAGDASTKLATTAFVDARVSVLTAGASTAFDTFIELSTQMATDETGVAALTTAVAGKLAKASNLSDLTDAATARTNIGAYSSTGGDVAGPIIGRANLTLASAVPAIGEYTFELGRNSLTFSAIVDDGGGSPESISTGQLYVDEAGNWYISATDMFVNGASVRDYNALFNLPTLGTAAALNATTVGVNLVALTNPSAIRFLRVNADNSVSSLDAATFRTAIGAGTSSASGTVTSVVGGTGLTGGTITGSGTLSVSYGTTAGTAAQGNDSRLANARTPTAHASSHGGAGSDPITSLGPVAFYSGATSNVVMGSFFAPSMGGGNFISFYVGVDSFTSLQIAWQSGVGAYLGTASQGAPLIVGCSSYSLQTGGSTRLTADGNAATWTLPMRVGSYTVSTLPTTSVPTGALAYASNGRNSGEGAASGTGCIAKYTGSAWKTLYDNSTAAA